MTASSPSPSGESPKPTKPPIPDSAWMMGLIALLCLVGATRLVAAWRSEIIARDGTAYLMEARDIATEGLGKASRWHTYPPGYPSAVAAIARATRADWPGGWADAGVYLSAAMAVVAAAAIFCLARALAGPALALLTAMVFSLGREYIEISGDVLSDSTALALMLLAVLWALRCRQRLERGIGEPLVLAGLSGLAAGLAYLTRPEGLLSILVSGGLLLRIGRSPRRTRRVRWACVATMAALAAAVVLPYALHIGSMSYKKGPADLVLSSCRLPLAAITGAGDVLGALRRALDQMRTAMGNVAAALVLVAVATWAGMALPRLRLPREVQVVPPRVGWWLMGAPLAIWLPLLVALELAQPQPGYISTRHFLFPMAMLSPAAGIGLVICVEWTRIGLRRLGKVGWQRLAWPVWVAAAFGASLAGAFPPLHPGKAPIREAAELAGRQLGDQPVWWLAPSGWIPFYAGAPADQWRLGSLKGWGLEAHELADVEALARAAHGLHLRTRQAVAIGLPQRLFRKGKHARLLEQIQRDGRFLVMAWPQPADEGVWVLLYRPRP